MSDKRSDGGQQEAVCQSTGSQIWANRKSGSSQMEAYSVHLYSKERKLEITCVWLAETDHSLRCPLEVGLQPALPKHTGHHTHALQTGRERELGQHPDFIAPLEGGRGREHNLQISVNIIMI